MQLASPIEMTNLKTTPAMSDPDASTQVDTQPPQDVTPIAGKTSADASTLPMNVRSVDDFDLDALAAVFRAGPGAALTVALIGSPTEAVSSPRLVASGDDAPRRRCDLTNRAFDVESPARGVALAYDGEDGTLLGELEVHPVLAAAGSDAVLAGLRQRLGHHLEELFHMLVEARWDLDLALAIREHGLPDERFGKVADVDEA